MATATGLKPSPEAVSGRDHSRTISALTPISPMLEVTSAESRATMMKTVTGAPKRLRNANMELSPVVMVKRLKARSITYAKTQESTSAHVRDIP